jgi:diacylglycerol kinase (ATP)
MRLSFLCQPLASQGDELRVLLMHNPTAGDEDHSRGTLRATLEEAGHEVSWQSMKESDWERALEESFDLVVAAGGDGTVRKVFRQIAGKDVPATILPLGTANNIARSLGFEDDDPGRLVHGWPQGRLQTYDIGSLSTARGADLFVESAGAGLFADVLVRAESDESDASDKIEKGLRLVLESLDEQRALPWTLELDGDRFSDELIGLAVMNASGVGPQIPLAPAADAGDGVLDVVLLRDEDVERLHAYVEARLARNSPEPPQFEVRRAVDIAFEPPAGCPVHVDDELVADSDSEKDSGGVTARPVAQLRVLLPDAG